MDDSICLYSCGAGFGKHKHKCFALPSNILQSLRSCECAIYGTTSSCVFSEDLRPYKQSCPLLDPNSYGDPIFLSFRRYPKCVEYYRPTSYCLILGEWNCRNDTLYIVYKTIVENDGIKNVSDEKIKSIGAPVVLKLVGNQLISFDFDDSDIDMSLIKTINPYLISITEEQEEESYNLIYGEQDWWRPQ